MFCRISDVEECFYEDDVWKVLSNITADEPVMFFDKFFLGYIFENTINELKYNHKERTICFCEMGDCHPYFGLRIHEFKVDSFISHIEEPEHMKKELSKVMAGIPTYPEEVESYLKNIKNLDHRNFGEVTLQEEKVGALIGDGYSQKQASYILETATQTVNTQLTYLRNKTGSEKDADFFTLNKQTFKYAYD